MSSRGFTLIEMMVTIALLTIALGIAVPEMRSWLEIRKTRAAAEALLDGVRLARQEALTRNAGVEFRYDSATRTWAIGCAAVTTTCPATIRSREVYRAGNSTSITVNPTGTSILTFTGIGTRRATNADTSAPMQLLTASSTLSSIDQEYAIAITAGGQNKLCDPAVATAGDPRKCP
ncbi:GspH/FimT family pseudopilin [Chitinimonas sp. BJYL2]|uniref:GspH/FimT family pseudopilin n=1 Tax=Chitinimonas sp. BJYL2 TaxID=2976696 RepID=UPI0022B4ABEF|nr:GspH/FimT family pseudopilin [Chitinimonas sp. BJYL2]